MKYIFLVALTTGWSGQSFALDAPEQEVRKEATKPHPACPSQDFSVFHKAFSESVVIQRAFTKYPLEQQLLDKAAVPEPKPFLRHLRRSQVSFPVIPEESERKLKSLTLSMEKIEPRKAKLKLFKDDTDWQVLYFFTKTSCWNLERIEDWSL